MYLEGVCQKAGLREEAMKLGMWGKPFAIYKEWFKDGSKRWAVHPKNAKARVVLASSGPFQRIHDGHTLRNLTLLEMERAQGLPEGFTDNIDTVAGRVRLIRNAFQLDTIMYILSYI